MKVKICGITHPEDAEQAAHFGADFIGILFSESSKRRVLVDLGKEIAQTARHVGVEPVGVFVDETAEQIISICQQTGITTVQLHGSNAKKALTSLEDLYSIIYAFSVDKEGKSSQEQKLSPSVMPLYDYAKGGTGVAFDWSAFSPPDNTPWILAGGLNPENVVKAITLLKPYGVDVSSGVEFPDRIRKNPVLVKTFIQAAKHTKEKI